MIPADDLAEAMERIVKADKSKDFYMGGVPLEP